MSDVIRKIFSDEYGNVRHKTVLMYAFLVAVNIGAWVWAIIAFHDYPVLLGTALLAYSFGLRHAVDVDHIAAIDNVTRKMMQQNKRPVTVGFYFSMGHSLVLIIATVIIVLTLSSINGKFDELNNTAGIIGTSVSAIFLVIMALLNIVIASSVYKTFRDVKDGGTYSNDDFDVLLNKRGILSRVFRPLFKLVDQSWHMFFVGFLFGLGFDTLTEVSLLAIAGTEAAQGMSIWSILAFPALFAAGMSMVDTTDGVLMLNAYGWAFMKPIRKLYYNLTITVVSAMVALVIGGIESMGIFVNELNLNGGLWTAIKSLNGNFGLLGLGVIVIFAASWAISMLFYRIKRYDELEVQPRGMEKIR